MYRKSTIRMPRRVRKPTPPPFSYDVLAAPEAQDVYDKTLLKHGLQFLSWRTPSPTRMAMTLGRAVDLYISCAIVGKVQFATPADKARFRDELLVAIPAAEEFMAQTIAERLGERVATLDEPQHEPQHEPPHETSAELVRGDE